MFRCAVFSVLPYYLGRRRCGELMGYGIALSLGSAALFFDRTLFGYPRVAAAALLGDPAQGREAPLSTRALLLFEVPGAAAAGCGHDGIHRHHADVGQPEGALPRVHRHNVSQDQRGRSGAVFSRIGGCDAAAGASAPGRDRNPPFTASVPPPVQRAPPAACRRRC